MDGWFCPIRVIHLIRWKSLHFEKKIDNMNIPLLQIEPNNYVSYDQNLKRTYKMRLIVCLSN